MNFKISIKEKIQNYFFRLNRGIPKGSEPDMIVRPSAKVKPSINLILFIATLITTTHAGIGSSGNIADDILHGLKFSVTLLAIISAHEFGHYFAARKFGIESTLPFYIPFPTLFGQLGIGTMGAVIKITSPIPDRKALLYVGAMGPISGFIVCIAAAVYGISVSIVDFIPIVTAGEFPIFGDSLLFAMLIKIIHGTIPAGKDLYLSPFAWASWIGFLITGLNLMPIGQLDGGHVLYSMFGNRQKFAGWVMVLFLVIFSFFWQGWIVWLIITFAFLMIAHPPVPDIGNLTRFDYFIGILCILIFFLTFIPKPIDFI
jgi:membrane-associated protease RseP (regulator of RpoE activity)